ncbi:glycosyltransferase family 2 protein [Sphingomonas sp.]|jgi:hypothetical protein|uniref:glycosyltransferase family 2 protein n=1 Tax=Sphingomonas sp. TaxID=28214 RepID=UPI002D7ED892|nr:glycosyltransferase family 2 protein [Sphingomonas sp.]HEU0044525.1 glycosyltransferase family 2 protein [Sphingomonas sp.]
MNSLHRAEDISSTDQVDIVTVNWNAGHQLAECVESVQHHDEQVVRRFIVVDNGSHDGSADFASDWPKLLIDRTQANLGFGRACNRGVALSDAPFILFLNPDTRLTEPAISRALAFLRSAAGRPYAVCGIKLIDETGHATQHCARFPTLATFAGLTSGADKVAPGLAPPLLMKDFDHLSSRDVDHVQGAFYLVRREVFEQVGGFDEDFFVYLEDLDLSLRIARAGYKSYYLADTSAFHRGGGTSGQVKGIARFYGVEARLLYARKHFDPAARRAHAALTYAVEPFAVFAWHLVKYRGRGLGGLRDYLRLLARNTPDVLTGSSSRQRGDKATQLASTPDQRVGAP